MGESGRERERAGERAGESGRARERAGERERDSGPQPLFGPSVVSFCRPCIAATDLPQRFPIFETSATVCAVLLVATGNV